LRKAVFFSDFAKLGKKFLIVSGRHGAVFGSPAASVFLNASHETLFLL